MKLEISSILSGLPASNQVIPLPRKFIFKLLEAKYELLRSVISISFLDDFLRSFDFSTTSLVYAYMPVTIRLEFGFVGFSMISIGLFSLSNDITP